jgi:hypothetical protein
LDLNYLYERHQISLYMAENAPGGEARQAHREFAKSYATQIADAKRSREPARAVSCNS